MSVAQLALSCWRATILDIANDYARQVHTAGGYESDAEETRPAAFAIFARGPFFLMQEAARLLPEGGRIINISSVITQLLPPFAATYAGSKAATEAFAAVLAAELAPRRITVNSVLPGAV